MAELRISQPTSPDSTHSIGSPGKKLSSSCAVHPSSEDSLPEEARTEHGLDTDSMPSRNDENRQANSWVKRFHVGAQPNVLMIDESFSPSHDKTNSASTFSQGIPNEVSSQVATCSTDALGELNLERRSAVALYSASREPKLSPRFETKAQPMPMGRQPLSVPRIVSYQVVETGTVPDVVEIQIQKLVEDLKSASMEVQSSATAELRLLAKQNTENRIIIANCGGIPLLVNLLRSRDLKTQENAVTALLNLSINDNNKTAIGYADAIEALIHVLMSGTAEAKENTAATFFSLSVIEKNKVMIGRSGAIQHLVDLLGNGTPLGKKDAATALFNLSTFSENKPLIVQASAVKHLVELMDPAAGMVDKAIAVLSNLATIHEGRTSIGQEGGIPVLVEVVELGSGRQKENAAAALLHLCNQSNRFCNTVLQEGAVPPLVALSQSGTPRAKKKAQALLSHFRNQRHSNGGRG